VYDANVPGFFRIPNLGRRTSKFL